MRGGARHCATIVALLVVSSIAAQENSLDVGLNILTHGEIRDGGLPSNKNGEDFAAFAMGRTRLTVDYKRQGLEAKVIGQSSSVWGAKGSEAFKLYEAWGKLSTKQGFFAQIGRQALAYDDERIIGPNDWAMAAKSHDVLRLGYEGHGHKLHTILAYNQTAANTNGGSFYIDGSQPYKNMQTLWYHYDLPKVPLGASLLFMNIGMQGGDTEEDGHTEYQQLVGGYVKYAPKQWSAEFSYYRQMGTYEEGNVDINAWMLSTKLQLEPAYNYGFLAGFDYLSGDDQFAVPGQGQIGVIHHKTIKGFNPVYGSHHQFYGAMDFFYVSTYVNGFTPGLQNAYIGGHYKPIKGLDISAKYHYLAIATNLKDIDKTLGHEIEIEASYKIMKDVNLSAGYSYMIGTETMERLKRASDQGSLRWAWLSLGISPKLFTNKW